jgi:GTP-binding protein
MGAGVQAGDFGGIGQGQQSGLQIGIGLRLGRQIHGGFAGLAAFEKAFLKDWAELPPYFQTSAETGYGRDKLLAYIESVNAQLSGRDPLA